MMALNIKTEPLLIDEPTSVVELSSDDDDCVEENKNIDPEPKPKRPERLPSPDTHCSICLDELSNRCYSESCFHMFCFECLKRWATITSSCPLCKKDFKTILHTFNDQGLHETYVVPLPERQFTPRISIRPFAELYSSEVYNNRVFNITLFIDLMRRNERMVNNDQNENLTFPNHLRNHENISHRGHGAPIHYRRPYFNGNIGRAHVYSSNVWAEPLPDLSGRFRDCTLDFYRENTSQTHRLHGFVLRDVIAIRTIFLIEGDVRLEARITNEEITRIIMLAVLDYEIRSIDMATHLLPYLGSYTDHFCHELYNYANSPYDLIGYDTNVRYSSPENHSMAHVLRQSVTDRAESVLIPVTTFPSTQNETIILDSTDSDSSDSIIQNPRPLPHDVIIVSSTEDDSEIEILEHHIRPTYDLSQRDQPSTSTGIRDSLSRPSSRYNLKRRRLCRPTNSSGRFMRVPRFGPYSGLSRREEEPSNYVSSSNDEEPTTIGSLSDSSQAMHDVETEILYGKRKKKLKRSKNNRQKTDDSSELHFSSTNHSYADWSSSDESDARPQIRHTSVCFNIVPRT